MDGSNPMVRGKTEPASNAAIGGPRGDAPSLARQLLNKVPEITLYFWIVKILCTTVGETAADYLNAKLHMGLTNTTLLMGSILVVTLVFQFRAKRYVHGIYWLAVVLLSVVGTLITDNLTDHFNIPLVTTTIIFAVALAVTFGVWYAVERSLSIHSIHTTRREAFYWLAILFTFALGTAAGDLVAEKAGLGYLKSMLMVAGIIGVVAVAHFRFKLPEIPAFWTVYILTRPLGASIGDLLSQARADGGLGFGTTLTSAAFLIVILFLVTYLAYSKKDVVAAPAS